MVYHHVIIDRIGNTLKGGGTVSICDISNIHCDVVMVYHHVIIEYVVAGG